MLQIIKNKTKLALLVFLILLIALTFTGCDNGSNVIEDIDDDNEKVEDEMIRNVNLEVVNLKDNSIEIEIISENNSDRILELNLASNSYNDKREVEIGEKVVFQDLHKDTIYDITLKKDELVLEDISLKTFSDIREGYQLFYYLDASIPDDHNLKVKIFGQLAGLNEMYFVKKGYHTKNGEGIEIVENSLDIKNGTLIDEENLKIKIEDSTDYFNISYYVDKSFLDIDDHGSQGYLGKDYLMISGEQALLIPEDNIDFQVNNLTNLNIYGYLNIPNIWEKSVGFESENDLLNLLSFKDGYKEEGILASNIYAYNKFNFNENTDNIQGDNVKLIFENSINAGYMEDVFNIYSKMAEKWGSRSGVDEYTIMISDDSRRIYAGEWTNGQGFSNAFEITGEMLAHQIYHLWNGWELGIEWNHGDKYWGFWSEGFNVYYCDKVRTELGIINHDDLKEYYNWYKSIKGTDKDVPILEYSYDKNDWRIIYQKGALLAYLLDEKIQVDTDGKYSLDDLLKFAWSRWDKRGKRMNYEVMKDYIKNDLGIEDLDNWWQKYIIDNEAFTINF